MSHLRQSLFPPTKPQLLSPSLPKNRLRSKLQLSQSLSRNLLSQRPQLRRRLLPRPVLRMLQRKKLLCLMMLLSQPLNQPQSLLLNLSSSLHQNRRRNPLLQSLLRKMGPRSHLLQNPHQCLSPKQHPKQHPSLKQRLALLLKIQHLPRLSLMSPDRQQQLPSPLLKRRRLLLKLPQHQNL